MAKAPTTRLEFAGGCPDCGMRVASLPWPLPVIEDDFDWDVRDYDSFRLFMMEELAHRFPERRRWTPADMEVVLVELLAAALDRMSHALDTVHRERFLDSARRPESVRRLLEQIGYDARDLISDDLLDRFFAPDGDAPTGRGERLERYWRSNPASMEEARIRGPLRISEQRRMVTVEDYRSTLEAHPLVARARCGATWTGSWYTLFASVLLAEGLELDGPLSEGGGGSTQPISTARWLQVEEFHRAQGLHLPTLVEAPSPRRILNELIERRRLIGSEVRLVAPVRVPIAFAMVVMARPTFFRSELERELREVFTVEEGGFFQPGRFGFGEDLFASDLIEAVVKVEGVEAACLNRFRRIDGRFGDQTDRGKIAIGEDEVVICENGLDPTRGYFRIAVNGGAAG